MRDLATLIEMILTALRAAGLDAASVTRLHHLLARQRPQAAPTNAPMEPEGEEAPLSRRAIGRWLRGLTGPKLSAHRPGPRRAPRPRAPGSARHIQACRARAPPGPVRHGHPRPSPSPTVRPQPAGRAIMRCSASISRSGWQGFWNRNAAAAKALPCWSAE